MSNEQTSTDNSLALERDLAVKQCQIQQANLRVIRMALSENRPLEALRQVNDAIDEVEEALDNLEEMADARKGEVTCDV